MAISRILHINSHEHSSSSHLQVAINYILKDEKTMNGLLTGSVNCIKEDAYENMKATKKLFGKTDKRQGYHLIISFEENECDENTAMKVFDEKLSVRETEKLVKNLVSPAKKEKTERNTAEDAIYESLEEKMKNITGTRVFIHRKKNNKGKIEIEYYSRDELERIIDLFESIR